MNYFKCLEIEQQAEPVAEAGDDDLPDRLLQIHRTAASEAVSKWQAEQVRPARVRWDRPCYKCKSRHCDRLCQQAEPVSWAGLTDEKFDALCEKNGFGAVARGEFPLVPRKMLKTLVDAALSQQAENDPIVQQHSLLRYALYGVAPKQQQAEPVVVQAKPVVWDPQCPLCGVGDGGKAMGYVCPRGDCPTKVTCGGAV